MRAIEPRAPFLAAVDGVHRGSSGVRVVQDAGCTQGNGVTVCTG